MPTHRIRRGALAGGLLLLLAVRCSALPPADFLCEAAVAHLASCCPRFAPGKIDCATANDGCEYTSLPVLQAEESRCILGLDCGALRQASLCGQVQALPPAIHETACDASFLCQQVDYDRPPVCR